uniref:Uncharacterized protein n=1 Tax=viral metagenome TaxID=1070528 RepID=A0A2V0RC64_9ZZZZ
MSVFNMLQNANNTPTQNSTDSMNDTEPLMERTMSSNDDVDSLFSECDALLADYESSASTPVVSPTDDTPSVFIPKPKPRLDTINEQQQVKPRFSKPVNTTSTNWKSPKNGKTTRRDNYKQERTDARYSRNTGGSGKKCVIRSRRVSTKDDGMGRTVFDDGLKPKTDSANVTSVPGMIKQLRGHFNNSSGFTITANQPLITLNEVSYSVPKCTFGHNDFMWFYDSIIDCIEKGTLDINFAPTSKLHTTDRSDLPSVDQLRKTRDFVSGHCILTCPLRSRDTDLESGRSSGRELKYNAFTRFGSYVTPMDAFDAMIDKVNFSDLSNDFTDFINATNGDYLLFIVLINKMCDELSLSQTSQLVPVLPGAMTTDLYHSLDDCNTIDTSPGSYIHNVLTNITDTTVRTKLEKRIEFVTYVQNICSTGLRTAIARGPITLTLKTLRDDEICINDELNRVRARMFTTMAIYAETIETVLK